MTFLKQLIPNLSIPCIAFILFCYKTYNNSATTFQDAAVLLVITAIYGYQIHRKQIEDKVTYTVQTELKKMREEISLVKGSVDAIKLKDGMIVTRGSSDVKKARLF